MSYIFDMSNMYDRGGVFLGQGRNERMRDARKEAGLSQAQLARGIVIIMMFYDIVHIG